MRASGLSDQGGRHVIILNFFATWCGPCRAEMPELQRYAQAHRDEGVILLGIDAEEKHTILEQFFQELQLTFPIGIDGSGDLLKEYGVAAFPTTVVIGADGRVKLYETGAISNADVAFGAVVAPELAAIREGRGTTVEAYRAALAAEPRQDGDANQTAPLTGRARQIAEAMPCPCGCDDRCTSGAAVRPKQSRHAWRRADTRTKPIRRSWKNSTGSSARRGM